MESSVREIGLLHQLELLRRSRKEEEKEKPNAPSLEKSNNSTCALFPFGILTPSPSAPSPLGGILNSSKNG